ncbi:tetratricopeptide repeat protein [Agromyces humi]|uniref:tetratricopeptide repeat protein n=1 Tax=Agromyces humi TaxID=1766800 RepID=UPI0013576A87|nr:tetratricopeptide repeat protein [Agromyces humi]
MTNDPQLEQLIAIASSGDPDALMNVGIAYNMRGHLDEAFEWFIRSADAGNVRAYAYLGWLFKVMGDHEQAVEWTRRAVEAGEPNAPQLLESLVNPPDVVSDSARAATAMAKTLALAHIEQGNWDQAQSNLAFAANGGDVDSFYLMGVWWEGHQQNLGHAILFYSRASQGGHDKAMFRLALILDRLGDHDTASGWFSNSAAAGNADAQRVLAGRA